MIGRIIDFFREGIWRRRLAGEHGARRIALKYLRTIILAVREFIEDECPLRASALTFYTLLSIVPLVALAFGIAKGFGLEEALRREVMSQQGWQASISALILDFAVTFLQQARGGLIAGVGVIVLLWSAISILGNIEKSFNAIWEIRESRTLLRQFTDYLSMILVGTILLIVASGMTVAVAGQVKSIGSRISILGTVTPAILFLLQFVPYVIIWALFSFVFIFMPNTAVDWDAGLAGGIIAGSIYQLTQWVYIRFQVGVSSYGAVYGGFAALPLFLAWLQVSWMIVLFGAEISYAAENVETYGYLPDYSKLSDRLRLLLLLRIVHLVIHRFLDGAAPPSAVAIADTLRIPARLVRQSIYRLTDARLITAVLAAGKKQAGYQPRCDIAQFTLAFVISAIERNGIDALPAGSGRINEPPEELAESLWKIERSLREFESIIRNSDANARLVDI